MTQDKTHNVIALLPNKKLEVVTVGNEELNKFGYVHSKLALSNDILLSPINIMEFNISDALRGLYLLIIDDVKNVNYKYNLTLKDRYAQPCIPIFGGLMVTGISQEGDLIGISKEQEQILRRIFERNNERLTFRQAIINVFY